MMSCVLAQPKRLLVSISMFRMTLNVKDSTNRVESAKEWKLVRKAFA